MFRQFPPSGLVCLSLAVFMFAFVQTSVAQSAGKAAYSQMGSFQLVKGSPVSSQVVKNDRVTIILSGTIYFSDPVNGKHTGAVFIGTGSFSAPIPESSFEKAHVRRLLK